MPAVFHVSGVCTRVGGGSKQSYSWSFTGINVLKHGTTLVEWWNCICSWLQDPGSPPGSRNILCSAFKWNSDIIRNFCSCLYLYGCLVERKHLQTTLIPYFTWTSISITRSSLKLLITARTCACWAQLLGIVCVTPEWFYCSFVLLK